MSDPAVVAAQQVWESQKTIPFAHDALWSTNSLIPAARAMAEPLRGLHRPVHPVFNWSSGLQLLDPCSGCNGKAGCHPCGCWGDEDTLFACLTCRDGHGRLVDWPCVNAEHLYSTEELER